MARATADAITIRPARTVSGRIRVPGDKSISHRYALLAALADGHSTIEGYSPGADCASTLACLQALGVSIERDGPAITIAGRGVGGLVAPAGTLDAGNSGTTMRLLSGILAAHPFTSTIGGDSSLSRRPMRRVIAPLTAMGAEIASTDGRPPLIIHGAELRGIAFSPEVPSAQVKSAVLLAGLHARGATEVREPAPTRDHTERALGLFGVPLEIRGGAITIHGPARLRSRSLRVPGDPSGAAFWCVLAAAHPGGAVTIDDVGLNPTRTAFFDILTRAGASIEATADTESGGEPVGRLTVRHRDLRGFEIAPAEVPLVIDEVPALAALAALLPPGETCTVRGAAELRVKESDRISALAAGLRALGARVTEFDDGFAIEARPLTGGLADAAGDHRLAMAFAIAATGAAEPSTIDGASSVSVSYPGFFHELRRLTVAGDR